MLFNSFEFLIFFPVVTILFFLLPHKFRWFLLLIASCYFYMSFVPIYILILYSTIVVDYFAGILLEKTTGKKKHFILVTTIILNILILCIFKYYNFFIENTNAFLQTFGYKDFSFPYLNILLPIGLSFHTFQALSYVFEVSRGNVKAERHFGIYSLYVMFYPQLVAGPIERPQNMLHQFHEKKFWNSQRVLIGLKIMLWGFVKKIVIADRLALYLTEIHYNPEYVGTPHLWLAVFVFFPFQVYCDFSGYSSIALGSAKVMGFELMENFRTPFSSITTSELWNRWHISLSTWFRDYVYQPLVMFFRDYGKWAVVLSLMITFFLSGFWHGAGWNFIAYGVFQGAVMAAEFWLGVKTTKLGKTSFGRIRGLIITYFLFACSLIFFRAEGMNRAILFIKRMFWDIDLHFTYLARVANLTYILSILSILLLIYFEKNKAKTLLYQTHGLRKEVVISSCMILAIIIFGVFHNVSFIYFQF
jgi:D-alanyl-lipoteichoic acid acyltransferase DltB (MBOAT superfamily)